MKRIFVSSVQKEFAGVRRLLKRYVARNPAYRRLFDTFVFEEDVVAADRRTDEVYLGELRGCDIYLGLIGDEYGFEDASGVSPTEREYDEATRLGIPRLLFVRGRDSARRHPKEAAFLSKVSAGLIRARCDDDSTLLLEVYASLDALLLEEGVYRLGPFDAAPCNEASWEDIDGAKVAWFVERARTLRNADWAAGTAPATVFRHLKLGPGPSGGLSAAALLLFGRNPQRFFLSAEVKCAQWYGTERHKPMLSYQIYKGTLFDMADAASAFVLSRLNLSVGTRAAGLEAPREYEIPQAVVAEAIVNAIAHRDYSSTGGIQVELFSDRLVIRNPGRLHPAITPDELFREHSSFPNNPLIADALYQAKYIERFGTGFTDLVADCRAAGLPDPTLEQTRGEVVLVVRRPAPAHPPAFPETLPEKFPEEFPENLPEGLGETALAVLKSLYASPRTTIGDLAASLGRSPTAIKNAIVRLRKRELLLRVGSARGGHWKVVLPVHHPQVPRQWPAKLPDGLPEKMGEGLGETAKAILQTLCRNPRTSTADLASTLGLSQRAIKKNTARLRDQGLLVRVGPARGGHWKVILQQTRS